MGTTCCGRASTQAAPFAPESAASSDRVDAVCCSDSAASPNSQCDGAANAIQAVESGHCCSTSVDNSARGDTQVQACCTKPASIASNDESKCGCCSTGETTDDDGCEEGCCADDCEVDGRNNRQAPCLTKSHGSTVSCNEAGKTGCCSTDSIPGKDAATGKGYCSSTPQESPEFTCCDAGTKSDMNSEVSEGCCRGGPDTALPTGGDPLDHSLAPPRTTCCSSAGQSGTDACCIERGRPAQKKSVEALCGGGIDADTVSPPKTCCSPKPTTCCGPTDQDDVGACCEPRATDQGCCGNATQSMRRDDIDTGCVPHAAAKGCCDKAIRSTSRDNVDACCESRESVQGCCDEATLSQSSEPAIMRQRKKEPARARNKALFSGKRAAFASQKEPMCPCCVDTMLKTNLNALEILISRVSEAHSRFKRCCIAFADLCCAKSRTEDGCCETDCGGKDCIDAPRTLTSTHAKQEVHEEEKDIKATGEPDEQTVTVLNGHVNYERVVLEVIGMDCPDCLSKVTRAVKVLTGAEVVNADAVRGLVDVQYDPNKIDLKAIQTFTARASGFTINALSDHPSERAKVLVLPLGFQMRPPPEVIESFDVQSDSSSRGGLSLSPFGSGSTRASGGKGQIKLVLPLDSAVPPKPRDVMARLAPYKPTLRRHLDDKNQVRINRDLLHISFRTLASLILNIPILVLVWSPTPLVSSSTSQSVQLGLATLIVIVAWPVYSGSFRSAYYLHRADLDVLTSFSTLTSYVFSVVAFGFELAGRNIGEPFFETVGLLITLIFAGRTLQASTRKLGLGAIRNIGRLQPEHARLSCGKEESTIDVRRLHYDDVLLVKNYEVIPTDGIVLKGEATADESSLTGESLPVSKSRGSSVTAGTRLTTGSIEMAVTRLVPENAISAIADAVNSTSTGSDYQDLADRLAGWLLPIAGVCCLAAFIGWMLVEHLRRGQGLGEAVISGVGYAIAIAAVSCPCALAIAVTLVTSIAMATTVNDGVLFRSVQALLQVHSVKSVAFDKTGTLSQGVMSIQQTSYDTDSLSVQLLRAITAASNHPVSETVKRHLGDQADLELAQCEDIEILPGQGVSASFYGFPLLAGNAVFTRTEKHPLVQQYLAGGLTILVVTLREQLVGLFGMKDQARPGADQLIADVERDGKTVSLVSGDNVSAVQAFARDIGIAPAATHAAQSPTSKAQVVDALKQEERGKVAFVGDGINDIIALSTADFSIATGSASNASSQIIILASDVPKAMRTILLTSRLARNHVIASLAFCGVYFAVAILLASGVTGWRIPPAYAGLGELVSILPVLLVGAHLAVYRALQRRYTRFWS